MSVARSAVRFAVIAAAPCLGAVAALAAAPATRPDPSATTSDSAGTAYSAAVRSRIATQRALLRPFYLSTGRVVLGLEIDREGRLINGAILDSSGSSELDRTAARMATFAAPFTAPPRELAGDPITVKVVLTLPDGKAAWDQLLASAPPPAAW